METLPQERKELIQFFGFSEGRASAPAGSSARERGEAKRSYRCEKWPRLIGSCKTKTFRGVVRQKR